MSHEPLSASAEDLDPDITLAPDTHVIATWRLLNRDEDYMMKRQLRTDGVTTPSPTPITPAEPFVPPGQVVEPESRPGLPQQPVRATPVQESDNVTSSIIRSSGTRTPGLISDTNSRVSSPTTTRLSSTNTSSTVSTSTSRPSISSSGSAVQSDSTISAPRTTPSPPSSDGQSWIFINSFPTDFPIETITDKVSGSSGRGYVFVQHNELADGMIMFITFFFTSLLLSVLLVKSTKMMERRRTVPTKIDQMVGEEQRWGEGREVIERKVIPPGRGSSNIGRYGHGSGPTSRGRLKLG